jgi:hypothetical protein
MALVHRHLTGQLARAATPLEVVSVPGPRSSSAVAFLTAGGRNNDIIASFKHVLEAEPAQLLVMCARTGSPLGKLAGSFRSVARMEFTLPTKKDGFLATNSLLAFATLLMRGYGTANLGSAPLPNTLNDLLCPAGEEQFSQALAEEEYAGLWNRDSLVVLHGAYSQPAAIDLESKFSEAALGTVQLADFRNFAHGRHHWLSARGGQTAILALITEEDREIAGKTLALVPKGIPVARVSVPYSGLNGALAGLVQVLHVCGFAGKARRIDPGRPSVASFGRKIYNLRVLGRSQPQTRASGLPKAVRVAIERKAESPVELLATRGDLEPLKAAFREFCRQLESSRFRAAVFDYDGTLCDAANRFGELDSAIGTLLNGLLARGLVIGVVTGRGKSAKVALRKCVSSRLWNKVHIGYYNGADIGALADDSRPDGSDACHPTLQPVAQALVNEPRLTRGCRMTTRPFQITLEPEGATTPEHILSLACQLVYGANVAGARVVTSSHSVDILAPGVSKRSLVEHVRNIILPGSDILCVGDRGRWPGNDFELLALPNSLSSDFVSPDPATCWNLAPAGCRGVDATLAYMRALKPSKQGWRFDLESLELEA